MPTARPNLFERACLLTVPFQATVKSLSSPFDHAFDGIGVVGKASLAEQAGGSKLLVDRAQAELA
jgi:hypothetical protein